MNGNSGTRLDRLLVAEAGAGFNGVVLVSKDGQVVLHKGYGFSDRERTVQTVIDTPFWIASVSKTFAAAAVMHLVEAGRLSVGDTIESLIGDVPPDKRGITVHQLLSHTSGLAELDAADGITRRAAAVNAILNGAPAGDRGEFGYTNDAYNLLAAVVEVAARESYESFLRRNVLEPVGLSSTGFWGPAEHPHVAPIRQLGDIDSNLLTPNWGYRGATGMYSTAADLHTWFLALTDSRLLSAPSVDRIFAEHTTAGPSSVGYGWFTSPRQDGRVSVWSRGWEGTGHGALIAAFPRDEVIIVIVSNSDHRAVRSPMQHEIGARVADRLFASN